jgi:hypothetical protein
MKTKMIRRAHVHSYRSGKVGILRVLITCYISLRPVSFTVGHESYPILDEGDDTEYERVVLDALASTATEFGVGFCAPIPNVDRNQPAKCFRFAPRRWPVQVSLTASPVAHGGCVQPSAAAGDPIIENPARTNP